MKFLIILLPLLASLIPGLLSCFTNFNFSKYISTLLIISTCIIVFKIYNQIIIDNSSYNIIFYTWIAIDNIQVNIGFTLDTLSLTMLIPILVISSLVHIYSCEYMKHDPHQQRYFSLLSLFTAFMIILVTADNYLLLFVGWETIGISSYLLISFWYTRIQASKAALAALLYNKLGDTFLTVGIFLIFTTFASFSYDSLFINTHKINTYIINIIIICFFISVMTKSAQFGLHSWLLSSMEGPTPVSALLHAACLVCAGIYLLIRSSCVLECSSGLLTLMSIIGGITTLMAGLMAIASNDIKRIIALSTMSQLGLMVIAIGISAYNLSLYHLFCHAMFKALLFMAAGSIIHSLSNESQDIRTMGGLISYLPFTYVSLLIASLSLTAFPFLSGFYSKDIIIESIYGKYSISGIIIYIFSIASVLLTSIYSSRLIYLVFLNIPNATKRIYSNVKESNLFITIPMFILTILSIYLGYIFKDYYIGLGSNIYNNIFIHPNHLNIIETEFSIDTWIKLLPVFSSIFIIVIVLILFECLYKYLYIYNNKLPLKIYRVFNNKFMIDQIYNNIIIRSILKFSLLLNKYIEKGIITLIYITYIKSILNKISYKIISLSTYYNPQLNNKSTRNIQPIIPNMYNNENLIKLINNNKYIFYYNIYFIIGISLILIYFIWYNSIYHYFLIILFNLFFILLL